MSARRTPRGSSLSQRLLLLSQVDASGCRVWTACTDRCGYGVVGAGERSRTKLAHRAAYEAWVGPIPSGLTVDHVCFNRACINPTHLQLLTHSENAARQRSTLQDRCPEGHEYAVVASGRRSCKTCARAWLKRQTVRPELHGRAAGYAYGCRCDECKAYNAAQRREWRARRAVVTP